MKYLKTFESLGLESIILDLKDMALELIDLGFNINVYDLGFVYNQNADVIVTINKPNNFTMTPLLKDFIFRIAYYMKDNGYEFHSHSNFGRLNLTEDGRIILTSGEARENRPPFTMINITFKK
jgi:hypothetical protein